MMSEKTAPGDNAVRPLPLRVGVALSHAIIASSGLSYFVVKGPIATRLGVRPELPSSDVDVMVSPRDLPAFFSHLESRGWVPRPEEDDDNVFPHHSRTFYHPQWPNDIDVHWRFPGFSRDEQTVFDRLRAHHAVSQIAHTDVVHLDRIAAALVQLLHSLRSPWENSRSSDIEFLGAALTDADIPPILALAEELGALGPLRPFIEEYFPAFLSTVTFPDPDIDWIIRTTNRSSASIRIAKLWTSPWRDKPRLLLRALYPSREGLAATDLRAVELTPAELRRLRFSRFRSFMRNLPVAVSDAHKTLKELKRYD